MNYAQYLEAEISIHKMWGFQRKNIVFAVGKSIINKNSTINIGELMLEFEGGGHRNAGICQKIPAHQADDALKSILEHILDEESVSA